MQEVRLSAEPPHLLVIDDDRRIRELLVSYLTDNGFQVSAAANAKEAARALEGLAFDALVLDVMMPGENGLSFAAHLRSSGNAVPILMLSARSDSNDRIQGLSAGSDDYLGKPFEPEELVLRLRNLLRRAAPKAEKIAAVKFGDCVFDMETGVLERAGEVVHVTGREKDILRILAMTPGRPVPRSVLHPDGDNENARSTDVQITRLRQKIEKNPTQPVLLQTVRGQGYCLFAEAVSPHAS
jgi:two-component system, OmpR family, phosphate regulon response regulator OmpR